MMEKIANEGIPAKGLCLETLEEYPPLIDLFTAVQKENSRIRSEEEIFRNHAVLLDSSLHSDMGRYSILGWMPYLRLDQDGKILKITEWRYNKKEKREMISTSREGDFCDWLEAWMPDHFQENSTPLPMVMGGIGYLSYDYGMQLVGLESENPRPNDIADVVFEFFSNLMIEDHQAHRLYLAASGMGQEAAKGLQAMKDLLDRVTKGLEEGKVMPQYKASAWADSDFSREEYLDALLAMIRHIEEGDIYVANMTRQLMVDKEEDRANLDAPYDFFLKLRASNPAPFGAYADYGSYQMIGASPERFLQMRDGRITTRPIKGTRPRGKSPEEDAANRRELEESEKDKSELLMIVDLERNDLNRVCLPGSVKVTDLFALESYATVFHLVSTVVGELSPECGVWDLIRACFPGGSITGAPKLSAMQIIDRLEHSRRQLYTGSMGYISLNGDCDFNIIIRTALHQNGRYTIGAGGGITWESVPADEYDETTQKAAALLKALGVRETGMASDHSPVPSLA